MSSHHTLLEIRNAKQATASWESSEQLFQSLPTLHSSLLSRLTGSDERVSFEIISENQTTSFFVFLPTRITEYFTSIFMASFPLGVITTITDDPLAKFWHSLPAFMHSPNFLSVGSLKQSTHTDLIKLSSSSPNQDLLAPLLATLSKSQPQDRVAVQLLVDPSVSVWHKIFVSSSQLAPEELEQKANSNIYTASLRVLTSAATEKRSAELLEQVATSFQSFSKSKDSVFNLHTPFWRPASFFQAMTDRSWSHTKPLYLTGPELASLYHPPGKEVSHIANLSWGRHIPGEPPENVPLVSKDLAADQKKDVVPLGKAIVKNQEKVFGVHRTDRRRHSYIIGKTGTGKSTLLANMIIHDLKRGEGMCVIDPHGDLIETLLDYIPSNRINDVILFDPSDTKKVIQLNIFEGTSGVHRELIASGIVSVFKKLYAHSWGPRLEYILRNALLTLLDTPQPRLSDVVDLLTNADFRKKTLEQLKDPIIKSFWVNEFEEMSDKLRTEAVAPILNKVGQFVSSPLIRQVINSHKSSFSLEDAMNHGKIVLCNLSQGILGEDNATLLGAMIITKIQLTAMSRVSIAEDERRDFYLYVDEFQNFATESFIKILSEARKYRLSLILSNQYIDQLPENIQKAIFGNCGNFVSFVLGAHDAQVMSKEFGGSYVPEDFVSLARHQILVKLSVDNQSTTPFPGFSLAPALSSNKNRETVTKVSRERYARNR